MGSFAAIIISIMSLVVSIYETSLLDTQQRAMIWPYLDINTNYSQEGYSINAYNKGTGPSIIKSVEIELNEKKIKSYKELFDTAYPDRQIGFDLIRTSRISKTVYKIGASEQLIFIPWTNEGKRLIDSIKGLSMTITYCNVMDDCWVLEWPKGKRSEGIYMTNIEFED